jgi:hypothetical protein
MNIKFNRQLFTAAAVFLTVLFTHHAASGQNTQREEMITGNVSLNDLLVIDTFKTEYAQYFANYKVREEILFEIKQLLLVDTNIRILAIVGSWCGDTKEQLAVLNRILSETGLSLPVQYIAVDRNKQAQDMDLSMYDVERIPVFLFYSGEELLGKIIETPHQSMEEDILQILNTSNR